MNGLKCSVGCHDKCWLDLIAFSSISNSFQESSFLLNGRVLIQQEETEPLLSWYAIFWLLVLNTRYSALCHSADLWSQTNNTGYNPRYFNNLLIMLLLLLLAGSCDYGRKLAFLHVCAINCRFHFFALQFPPLAPNIFRFSNH